MNTFFLVLLMVIGYSVAVFFVFRAFIVGLSLRNDKVPYVPSDKKYMLEAFDALDLQNGDNFVDIGSGDGRVVMYVARRFPDVNCVGIENNRWLVFWSNFLIKLLRVRNAQFITADALNYDYSRFNKVYMYLTKELIVPLIPVLMDSLDDGSRVVSVKFGFLGLLDDGVEKIGDTGTQLLLKEK